MAAAQQQFVLCPSDILPPRLLVGLGAAAALSRRAESPRALHSLLATCYIEIVWGQKFASLVSHPCGDCQKS